MNSPAFEGECLRLEVEIVFLHHAIGAAAHTFCTQLFYPKKNVKVIPQAPYSPEIGPLEMFLFVRLKLELHGKRFETIEAIKKNSQDVLKAIPLWKKL